MPIEFVYFDLGRVLVDFEVHDMLARIASSLGCSVENLREALFGKELLRSLESGKCTPEEFFDALRAETSSTVDINDLRHAASAIFELKKEILPIVTSLAFMNVPRGILSNTNQPHWEYCVDRFSIVRECFSTYALSYELGCLKPDVEIYQHAAELVGVAPERIFFVDDMETNVEGAKTAGFDAVRFTSARQLVADLRARGVDLNL